MIDATLTWRTKMSTNQAPPSQFDNSDELADLMCYAVMDILNFEYVKTHHLCREIMTRLAQWDWWADKDETRHCRQI
jgi:hypothetical protein